MTALTLELPYPPSVNHYWKHTRNGIHYVTKQGKAYQSAVGFLAKNIKKFTGKVSLNVEIYPPDNRKRDIDNIFKALFDSLTYAGVIADDSLINKLIAEKHNPIKSGKIVVTIRGLE
ncbi:RusA family crossover junction endodeoxyribonuclease [Rodentibacter caecimuris]|uniref:RusA family crossover junction endodeoxyribonuclease n=1 Tax=Rodentibacter caecimuris TaxID=1796644 RepID=UPI00211A0CD8|nr:RusA family crossover junction endodeoxyribonuclease [Rodentibacter heylii]MCQ9124341.1 RusA family crossover junction endodeoxyribonuclease [Rodentibacter heylii]